jgi:glycosyltransferase involved in cell wall biosynthesis
VVATNVGGNAELVEDGVTGTLVPSANSEKLGATILAYWRDRRLTQRHGAASRQRVEERFSLGGMVAQYESLYARLLRSKRGALAGVEAA